MLLPKEKPEVPYLVCPIGLIGVGKTTVAKALAQKLSLVRVSNDEIRKLFHDRGNSYERVRDVAFAIMEDLVEQGHSIYIDSDCASKIDFIKTEAARWSVQTVWIHITAPENVTIDRIKERQPSWLGTAEALVENFHARKPLHEHFDLPFTYTFNTSSDDFENQIEESVQLIKNEVGLM